MQCEALAQIGLTILALIYLASGAGFIVAQFAVSSGPVHIMGDRNLDDSKAAQSLDRYEREDDGTSSGPPDPYLQNAEP